MHTCSAEPSRHKCEWETRTITDKKKQTILDDNNKYCTETVCVCVCVCVYTAKKKKKKHA